MEIFFSDEYETLWTAISSIMGIIATTLAIFALIYSMRTYRRTMQVVHYGEIDKMYFEILKEALNKPFLLRHDIERSIEEEIQYNTYAFIVWNFLESIYDLKSQSEFTNNFFRTLENNGLINKLILEDVLNILN